MIKYISSVKNPTVSKTAALKTEGTKNAFLLEGEKFIDDVAAKNIISVFSTDRSLCGHYEKKGAECFEVTESIMKKLSGESSASRLIAVMKKEETPMPEKLLLLDGIQDPGNVGTMIRTAYAFGFGVICGERTANPYLPKAVRSTAGALCGAYVEKRDLDEFIPELKADGYTVFGSALEKNAVPPKKSGRKNGACDRQRGQRNDRKRCEKMRRRFLYPDKKRGIFERRDRRRDTYVCALRQIILHRRKNELKRRALRFMDNDRDRKQSVGGKTRRKNVRNGKRCL